MRIFGRVVLWVFAVFGFLSLAVTTILVIGLYELGTHLRNARISGPSGQVAERVDDGTVLTIDLERPVTEAAPPELGFVFEGNTTPFTTLLSAIKRAGGDSRVKGMVVRAGSVGVGLAEAQELRDVIKDFRARGKFAYAYGDSFGEIAGGTGPYYVASAFDEIWLQPTGSLALTGIASQIPFFKGTLDKLGITPEFERRGEYKTAATEFTETKLLDSDRAAMDGLVHSIYDQIVAGIGDGRKLSVDEVKALIDGGPYTGDEALAKHLVDHIGYLDEAEDAAKRKAGGELVAAQRYLELTGAASGTTAPNASLGLIRAVGEIVGGRSDDNPFAESNNAAADTLVRAFDEAVKDDDVKAIVFRIESPGGSEVASETIWRAVKKAKEAGKPVIVSMADVAASGGYYIATPADKIVAEPTTITGSIGVFSGKFVTTGLWNLLGVSWDTVSVGKNATMAGSLAPFTPEQKQRFAALTDVAYKQFLTRVADGRHMDVAAVDAIAKGRVWTGVQAKERGLVDELGGLDEAVRLAKAAAHLPKDEKALLKPFPARRNPFEALFRGLAGSDGPGQAMADLKRLAELGRVLERLDAATAPMTDNARMRPMEIKD